MVLRVDVRPGMGLDDYAMQGPLAGAVSELRSEAARLVPRLSGRTVWMVNSTAEGGGVAEMLPRLVALLRELGIACEWLVIGPVLPGFFALTKRLHNMIHGVEQGPLGSADRELYDAVSDACAAGLRAHVRAGDVLAVHDPQPLGAGARIRGEVDVRAVWRCHIGLDHENQATRAAWDFLRRDAEAYDRAVFSIPEYIPPFLAGRSTVIHPAIDPLSHKNRGLDLHKHVGVLCAAGLVRPNWPLIVEPFAAPASRLQADGSWARATEPDDLGLLHRPIVTQVSRWDRLKGWGPLMEGFRRMKLRAGASASGERWTRALGLARLVLAGPDPASVQDDPEGLEVLEQLRGAYLALEPAIRADVALLTLPMVSRKQNALMVNALQRASTIVAQNSLREGFGLTVSEAMWKGIPILGNSQAAGIRQQVRDDLDGRLVEDPEDVDALAAVMEAMLTHEHARDDWGRSAQHRAYQELLVFAQLRRWLRLLADVAGRA